MGSIIGIHLKPRLRLYKAPLILGIGGVLLSVMLGTWQLQRLTVKQAVLQDIEYRLKQAPVPLTEIETVDATRDDYRPVEISGQFIDKPLYALTSQKPWGPGYQQIAAFETASGRILVERGYIPEPEKDAVPLPTQPVTLEALLHWPRERGPFTPEPDTDRNIWFARDVEAMATALQTQPILAVVRPTQAQATTWPKPVVTDGRAISNNHFQYAVTWFSLGLIWLIMSAIWVRRINRSIARF